MQCCLLHVVVFIQPLCRQTYHTHWTNIRHPYVGSKTDVLYVVIDQSMNVRGHHTMLANIRLKSSNDLELNIAAPNDTLAGEIPPLVLQKRIGRQAP